MVKRLDIIIFGATGFTGKRTIPHLSTFVKLEKTSFTWGVAGRTEKKLKDVLLEMGPKTGEDFSQIPIICADVTDIESIKRMTAQAKVIINAVGPYRLFGECVVEACIESATHYVDVTAEEQFLQLIQSKYHEAAMEKGIYLISACGLDSIPADLGAVFLQKNFEGTLNSIEMYIYKNDKTEDGRRIPGALAHYTTYESAIYVMQHHQELQNINPKLKPLPQFEPNLKFKGLIFKSELLNRWSTVYPTCDRFVMLHTQRCVYETYNQRPAQIRTYCCLDNFLHFTIVATMAILFALMSKFGCGRSLLLKYPRFFTGGLVSHAGPSDEKQENTRIYLFLVGKGWMEKLAAPTDKFSTPPQKTVIAKVSCKSPGYGMTCIAVVLSAIMVLTEKDKMPKTGGFYSPGFAFGNTSLTEKLNKYAGLKFELNPQL